MSNPSGSPALHLLVLVDIPFEGNTVWQAQRNEYFRLLFCLSPGYVKRELGASEFYKTSSKSSVLSLPSETLHEMMVTVEDQSVFDEVLGLLFYMHYHILIVIRSLAAEPFLTILSLV